MSDGLRADGLLGYDPLGFARARLTPAARTALGELREVLERVGDKWSMLIIVRLREGGTMRFGQLGRAIGGISQRMLTLTLRQLERDGLVVRTTYAEVPPRVEYALTELGRTLTDPVIALARWALENYAAIETNRARHDGVIEANGFQSATSASPA